MAKDNITEMKTVFTKLQAAFGKRGIPLKPTSKDSFMISHPSKRTIYYNEALVREAKLSKRAMIGALAHEFAHQVDYDTMKWFARTTFIWRYKHSHEFKRRAERRADKLTIANGYGEELLALQTEYQRKFPRRYLYRIRPYHLGMDEIKYLIAQEKKEKKK